MYLRGFSRRLRTSCRGQTQARVSHSMSRFHRHHVTISRRLRLTPLLIWLKPLFNHVPHFSRRIILHSTVPLRQTLRCLTFHCPRQVCILFIHPPHRVYNISVVSRQSQSSHGSAGDAFSKLNAQMHEIQTSLSRMEAKTHKKWIINTKTKMMAHKKVREKISVRLHDRKTLPRHNLRAIPSGVFITTHMVSEPENANSLARSTVIDLTCSNFTPKNSTSLQQIHLQICTTLTGATIITSMVIVHAIARSRVLTSKTIHRNPNIRRTVHIVTLIHYFGFKTKFPTAFSLWILVLVCFVCYANPYSTC